MGLVLEYCGDAVIMLAYIVSGIIGISDLQYISMWQYIDTVNKYHCIYNICKSMLYRCILADFLFPDILRSQNIK